MPNDKIPILVFLSNNQLPAAKLISEDGTTKQVSTSYYDAEKAAVIKTSQTGLFSFNGVDSSTCTLTFDVNGGENIEPVVMAVGRQALLPEAVKENSILTEWLDDENHTYKAGEFYSVKAIIMDQLPRNSRLSVKMWKSSIRRLLQAVQKTGLQKVNIVPYVKKSS